MCYALMLLTSSTCGWALLSDDGPAVGAAPLSQPEAEGERQGVGAVLPRRRGGGGRGVGGGGANHEEDGEGGGGR